MRTHARLAAAAVAVNALLGMTAWVLTPTKAIAWLFVISFPPLLWAFLESAAGGSSEAARAIVRMHRLMIAALALTLAVDVGSDLAIHAGLLGSDGRLVEERFNGLLRGALFALWGNHLPKLMSPWRLEREPFDWQGVHRFVGRVAVGAGLALILVWSTLPMRDADRAATIIVVTACALAVGYKLLSVLRHSGRVEQRTRT